ncbi:MAG: hypothetical protein H7Y33_14730, partial [Cytophagales bacterium]|nr:hypothetical protein [Rhizobacter sp.]
MNHRSTKHLRQRACAGVLGLACIVLGAAAYAADKPATSNEPAADGLVHCLLPGQVRRMGAFATSVTPRRAA